MDLCIYEFVRRARVRVGLDFVQNRPEWRLSMNLVGIVCVLASVNIWKWILIEFLR